MGIVERWREARGRVLRQEFEDLIPFLGPKTEREAYLLVSAIDSTSALMSNIYARTNWWGRRHLRKKMNANARKLYAIGDRFGAAGMALVRLHLESKLTPGDDAAMVCHLTGSSIEMAQSQMLMIRQTSERES